MEEMKHEALFDPSVSVVLPVLIREEWQAIMAKACLDIAAATTRRAYELVIVETFPSVRAGFFEDFSNVHGPIRYHRNHAVTNVCHNYNQAFDLATGDVIVYLGSDIFLKPGWLEAVLDCFAIPDCGAATLAASQLGQKPHDAIREGVYTPFMATRRFRDWRFDPEFASAWNDTDLVMRIYEAGFRMYRNWNVAVDHLGRQTMDAESQHRLQERGQSQFIQKHRRAKTMMFDLLVKGLIM